MELQPVAESHPALSHPQFSIFPPWSESNWRIRIPTAETQLGHRVPFISLTSGQAPALQTSQTKFTRPSPTIMAIWTSLLSPGVGAYGWINSTLWTATEWQSTNMELNFLSSLHTPTPRLLCEHPKLDKSPFEDKHSLSSSLAFHFPVYLSI